MDRLKTREIWAGWAGWLLWAAGIGIVVANPKTRNVPLLLLVALLAFGLSLVGSGLMAIRYRRWLGTWVGAGGLSLFLALTQLWPRLQQLASPGIRLPVLEGVTTILFLDGMVALGVALVALLLRRDAGPALLGGFSILWMWGSPLASPAPGGQPTWS